MVDAYSRLMEVRRAEQSSRGLARLPPDFFESVQREVATLTVSIRDEMARNTLSPKVDMLTRSLRNIQATSRDIVAARTAKILREVAASLDGAGATLNVAEPTNLLPSERATWTAILAEATRYQGMCSASPPLSPPPQAPLQPAPSPSPSPSSGPVPSAPLSQVQPTPAPAVKPTRRIRVTKDCPPIDMGHRTLELGVGDEAEVPEDVAAILVQKSMATYISVIAPALPPSPT